MNPHKQVMGSWSHLSEVVSIGVHLNDDVNVVWRPGQTSEALDDQVEVPDQERLVAGAAHQEGAHVGLQELPARCDPALELDHGHGVCLGGVGGKLLLEDLESLHPL